MQVTARATARSRPTAIQALLLGAMVVLLGLLAAPAEARELAPPCPGEWSTPFTDVDRYRTHGSAVGCLYELEITEGISATRFGYDAPLRHGQLASFVARSLDATEQAWLPMPLQPWFEGTSTHAMAIDRLYDAGILRSLDGYDPEASVSRAEMARMVAATLAHAGVTDDGTAAVELTDVDGHPEQGAIVRLASLRVVNGGSDGAFRPDALVVRAQMTTFLANLLAVIESGGDTLAVPAPPPEPPPPPPPPLPPARTSPEGWLIAPGDGPLVGTGGTVRRYSVEIASGLESRQPLDTFAVQVEAMLSEPDRGWTARGRHRLQRVEDPSRANIRVLLTTPAHVDRLCGRVGLNTAGIYSCWTGRFAALNSDRWFTGVSHIGNLDLYRTYLVNHEVGHGLGYGHVGCPGTGRLAPVMVQQSMAHRMGGCQPNGWPYP